MFRHPSTAGRATRRSALVIGLALALPLLPACGLSVTGGAAAAFLLLGGEEDDSQTVPAVSVESTSSEVSTGDVDVTYKVSDGQSDPVSVSASYSATDLDDPSNVETGSATLAGSTTGLATSPDGVAHTVTWDSSADLSDGGSFDVTLEVVATDSQGSSSPAASGTFRIGNDAPEVLAVRTSGTSGNIVIEFDLADLKGDEVDIEATFSAVANDGTDYSDEPLGAVIGGSLTDLATADDGTVRTYSFVWETLADANVRKRNLTNATITLEPTDDFGATGASATSQTFVVKNNSAPTAILSEPSAFPDDSGDLALEVVLIDDEADPVDLELIGAEDRPVPVSSSPFLPGEAGSPAPARARSPAPSADEEVRLPGLIRRFPFRAGIEVEGGVTFTDGDATVTGSSTIFLDVFQPGDQILGGDGLWYTVASVTDDQSLELTEEYGNSTTTTITLRRRHALVGKRLEVLEEPGLATVGTDPVTIGKPGGVSFFGDHDALVTDESSGDLVHVDIESGTGTTVVSGILGLAQGVDAHPSDATLAYVANASGAGAGKVLEADIVGQEVNRSVGGLDTPRDVAFEEGDLVLVVEDDGSGTLSRVDLLAGTVTSIASGLGDTRAIELDRERDLVYVTDRSGGRVIAVDLDTGDVSEVTTAIPEPTGVDLAADGSSLWVTANPTGGGELWFVGRQAGETVETAVETGLADLARAALDPRGESVVIAASGSGEVLRRALGSGVAQARTIDQVAPPTGLVVCRNAFSPAVVPGARVRVPDALATGPIDLGSLDNVLTDLEASSSGVTHRLRLDLAAFRPRIRSNLFFQVIPSDTVQGAPDESFIGHRVRNRYRARTTIRPADGQLTRIATADVDGNDGLRDVVVTDPANSRAILFPRVGPGRHGRAKALGDGSMIPIDLAIGDLDGTGPPDLVLVSPNWIATHLNGGSTLPSTPTDQFTAVDTPFRVELVDVDGDGFLDILTANKRSDSVTIYWNDENGGFSETSSVNLSLQADAAPVDAVGYDGNQSGRVDVYTLNENGTVSFFEQDGNRTFKGEVVVLSDAAIQLPTDLEIVEVDEDGQGEDLLLSHDPGAIVYWAQGHGSWTDTEKTELGSTDATGAREVAAVDLDRNGNRDVVVAARSSDAVAIFMQDDARFAVDAGETVRTETLRDERMFGPGDLQVADHDGDGFPDVATPATGSSTVLVFRQEGSDFFAAAEETPGVFAKRVALGDVDGDGDDDIAFGIRSENRFGYAEATGPGLFSAFPENFTDSFLTGTDPVGVDLADVDGDGDLDLVGTTEDADEVVVFWQSEPGTFDDDAATVITDPAVVDPVDVVAADVDGDDLTDLVTANAGSDDLALFLQDPDSPGTFLAPTSHATGANPRAVEAADIDGDGDLDLASANQGGDDVSLFYQTSPGNFDPAVTVGGVGETDGARDLAFADLDGDGDLDLTVAAHDLDQVTFYTQDDAGDFVSATPLADPEDRSQAPVAVVAADLDGDGDADVASANQTSNTITVFWQVAPGTFAAVPTLLESLELATPRDLVAGDLDSDGDLDLAAPGDGFAIFFRR